MRYLMVLSLAVDDASNTDPTSRYVTMAGVSAVSNNSKSKMEYGQPIPESGGEFTSLTRHSSSWQVGAQGLAHYPGMYVLWCRV